ncbi:MAG: AzlD domain-containing protein [Firmicutes bacterium]|nr:AzlD domain-containing protein [Bacillota bacterium]
MTWTVFGRILAMACVTYLLRMIPMVVFRKKITSPFLISLFAYMPYTILGAMTIPAIFDATGHALSAAAGFLAAIVVAFKKESLLLTALVACLAAYLAELVLSMI